MKKTTKISLMSGLVTAGALLCGVHIANAQTNIDTGYTITIPSEVGIDKDSGKASFSVSGKMDAQTELDVTTTSQNSYKLKCGSQFVDYTLDKQSFHIDNIKSANPKSFNEDFNITLANTNANYSGNYEDRLTFNIQCHKYTYELDMNSILDGKVEYGSHKFGSVDIYINGEKVADDVSDFNGDYPYGTEFEFKDLKGADGHHYSGVGSFNNAPPIPLKGKIGIDAYYSPRSNPPYTFCTPCYFKFDTNKLTINYHADGAQTWHHVDKITYDVSGKDIAYTSVHLYGNSYDAKFGLGDVSRLKKDGYTAKPNTWIVGKNGNKEIRDDKGLSKVEDIADYCGVLDEFKKNDTVIDLYPIWIPNTYTLTYILDGGSFNASTTQLFKYGSGNAISSEIPNKTGYDFVGWKWGDVTMQPGDTIPKGWGNFTLTAQWLKVYPMGTVLNIDGIEYMTVERKESGKYLVIATQDVERRFFQASLRENTVNQNTYEGSEIDKYLENEWYSNLSLAMKEAINSNNIKQVSYIKTNDSDIKDETGYGGEIYNTISRHVFLPSVEEIGKVVDLRNSEKLKEFLNGSDIWTRDSSKGYQYGHFYSNYGSMLFSSGYLSYNYVYEKAGIRPAFVIDLSKIDYTVTGTVNYK